MMENTRELDFCKLFYREDGVMEVHVFPNTDVDEKDVQNLVETSLQMTENQKVPVLIFIGEFSSFSKKAREFTANPEKERATLAIAYVTNNMAHKLIINFLLKVNKPKKPISMFTNERDALSWLKSFV